MSMLRTHYEHDYERAYNFLKTGILVLSRTEIIFPLQILDLYHFKKFWSPGISRDLPTMRHSKQYLEKGRMVLVYARISGAYSRLSNI